MPLKMQKKKKGKKKDPFSAEWTNVRAARPVLNRQLSACCAIVLLFSENDSSPRQCFFVLFLSSFSLVLSLFPSSFPPLGLFWHPQILFFFRGLFGGQVARYSYANVTSRKQKQQEVQQQRAENLFSVRVRSRRRRREEEEEKEEVGGSDGCGCGSG